MQNHIKAYKSRLCDEMKAVMDASISESKTAYMREMIKLWGDLCKLEKKMENHLTESDADHWMKHIENADGTTGAHWTNEETSAVAEKLGIKFDHITPCEWWCALNMMYSDYSSVASDNMAATPKFYAELAKAFLFDKDGGKPSEKLSAYYHNIVK